jgi:hypothetical protein
MASVYEYNYYEPGTVSQQDQINDSNPDITDVRSAFRKIQSKGDYMAAWASDHIPGNRYALDPAGQDNHFQGIQRLRQGNYMVISGGDPNDMQGGPRSHLFIIKTASRSEMGGWRSNVIKDGKPPNQDKIIKTIGIDSTLWHAGGISVLGDILAVPIERNNPDPSRIVFFHLNAPENPERFSFEINRPDVKATAVALTKLPNGYFLAAVLRAEYLDFYLSQSNTIFDGFATKISWSSHDVRANEGQERNFGHFQSINFINQTDGRLYLVGMYSTSQVPAITGKNYADLYEVIFPDNSVTGSNPTIAVPTITKVESKQFDCPKRQCHMAAAAGIHTDPSGVLRIYCAFHWHNKGVIKFNEFRPAPDSSGPEITSIAEAWIDLYEKDRFRGQTMSLRGNEDAHTRFEDYRRIFVEDLAFHNRVSSARFQIPAGFTYRLFKNRDFQGESYDLRGTGRVEEIRSFEERFNDEVESSCYVEEIHAV